MQQFIRRGTSVASLLLVGLAASTATASTPATSVIRTQWDIEALAMSGSQLAYDVSAKDVLPSPKGCKNKVLVRSLRTGTTQSVSGEKTCYADGSSTGSGVPELAFAGKRFAWIVNQGGNTQSYDYLRTASLPRPRERRLAAAARYGDLGTMGGNWIGHLVGSGNLLAVNRWSTNANGIVKRSELDLVGASGLRRVVVLGAKELVAQSADSGRIAVLRADGTVGIYDATGKLLLAVAAKSANELALRGNLLVLTKTRTLEIYDSRSGAFLRSWPVPAGAAALDAYGGLAAYADLPEFSGQRFKVHVLQLRTGKDVIVGTGTYVGRPRRQVQLEAPGLVYAKNPHTLVFITLRRLVAAVS